MNQGFQPFLKQWFQTTPGLVVFKQEKQLVDKSLNTLFGYFLVQLGCVSNENLLENSRITSKLIVDDQISHRFIEKYGIQWIQADLDFLPLGRDKVDVAFLPHTLETVDDPYYVLRQVDSMLLPEGHVVLTGFNRTGCMPFRLKHFSSKPGFKQARYRRASTIKEWLTVLGYEVKTVEYSSVMCFTAGEKYQNWVKLIEKIERFLQWFGFEFGNVYCLVAKKRVDSPTLVGVKWHLPRWKGLKNGSVASQRVKPMKNRNFTSSQSHQDK